MGDASSKSTTMVHFCFHAAFYFLKITTNILQGPRSKMCHGNCLFGLQTNSKLKPIWSSLKASLKFMTLEPIWSSFQNAKFSAYFSALALSPPFNECSGEIASEGKNISNYKTIDVKIRRVRTFLAVQGLRLCASKAGGAGSIPGRETRIPHAQRCGQKKEEK